MNEHFVQQMELRPSGLTYDEVKRFWRKMNMSHQNDGCDYGFTSEYVGGGIFLFANGYAVQYRSTRNVPTMWLGFWYEDGSLAFNDYSTGRCPGVMEAQILEQVSTGDTSFWSE